ncbi:MAG: MarR family winged helix-turn-helix transcriptional regulator [Deinococcales bacterium]
MLNTNATRSDGARASKDSLVDEIIEAFGAMRARRVRAVHRDRRDALSSGHLQVLARLQMVGPMPVSRVAATLGVSAAAATGMVGRMEERGLVRRTRDERDRRVVLVGLTSKGRTVLADIGNRGRASLARVLSRLDADELTQLRDGLRAFQRAAQELADEEAATEGARASAASRGPARSRPRRGATTDSEDADAPEDPR